MHLQIVPLGRNQLNCNVLRNRFTFIHIESSAIVNPCYFQTNLICYLFYEL